MVEQFFFSGCFPFPFSFELCNLFDSPFLWKFITLLEKAVGMFLFIALHDLGGIYTECPFLQLTGPSALVLLVCVLMFDLS